MALSETTTPSSIRDRVLELAERVGERCDLPPLPEVAARAMVAASDPECELPELARIVSADAALAARVLAISRSTIYLRTHPPRVLRDAVMTVGLNALRCILIAASARSTYDVDKATAKDQWSHSLLTGLAADELAAVAGNARGGPDFIAGLLHDVGRLILHLADPAAEGDIPDDSEEAETARYGFSHAVVGACLAERWQLDDQVLETILYHHGGGAENALRLQVADRLAHHIRSGDQRWMELPEDLLAQLGSVDLHAIETQTRNRFRDESALFD